MHLDDQERAFWMGTGASWEEMDSRERHWVWMGRAKMERWGQGAANSGRKGQTDVHECHNELAERRKARAQTGWSGGGVVLALQ